MKEYPVTCFCGSEAHLKPNELLYNGRSFGNGCAYICDRFPACRGSVGVHPNGKPLGTIPDAPTRKLRRKLHAIIDPMWQAQGYHSRKEARGKVYGYLRHLLDMSAEDCHIGNFDAETCLRAMDAIQERPYEENHDSH